LTVASATKSRSAISALERLRLEAGGRFARGDGVSEIARDPRVTEGSVRDNQHPPGPELAGFAQENEAWLRICRLPAYTPDLNPVEGIWSLLKRSMVSFAAVGCLAATGLRTGPW